MLLAVALGIAAYLLGLYTSRLYKKTPAFLTGSQAYGDAYRSPSSDYDMVIYVDDNTFEGLRVIGKSEWNQIPDSSKSGYSDATTSVNSLRIKHAGIDLTILKKASDYFLWKKVTNKLVLDKPSTHDEAKLAFKEAGTRYGNPDTGGTVEVWK